MINLKSQLNRILFFSTAVVFFSILSSCEKEPDELGLGVLPDEDNFVLRTDTILNIYATTQKVDSFPSFHPSDTALRIYPKYILGEYTDPVFGKTNSSLIMNYYPKRDTIGFGTNAVADSLIFYLSYDTTVLGGKNTNVRFRISELEKTLSYKEEYYTDLFDTALYKGRLVKDTIVQFKDTLLKIKITDPVLLAKLINTPKNAREDVFSFMDYFKGLYVETKVETVNGVLAYVRPLYYNSFSGLSLHYHNNIEDTVFNYDVKYGTVRVNKFTHDYTGTPVETALQNQTLEQKITYVQGMGGVGTRIQIPGIATWAANKKPVAINKAQLIIPVDLSNTDSLLFPKRLSIMAISSSNVRSYIEYGLGQTFIGGEYDSKAKVYTFNLTKHLHYIANASGVNTDFIVIADGYKPNATNNYSKVSLDFSQGRGAKLLVTYSKQ